MKGGSKGLSLKSVSMFQPRLCTFVVLSGGGALEDPSSGGDLKIKFSPLASVVARVLSLSRSLPLSLSLSLVNRMHACPHADVIGLWLLWKHKTNLCSFTTFL